MSTEITVLLADDHTLVRKGFRRILEDESDIKVVAEASSGTETVRLALEHRPDVIVMDLAMPEMDGVTATAEILKKLPATRILVLSMYAEEHRVRSALDAGACGYVLKTAAEFDLAAAVRQVAAGERVLGPQIAEPQPDNQPLTQRERQILQLIAQGNSNKEIAAMLGLSVNTVSVHRANLMQALGLHCTADLVTYAIRNGLVTLP